jgi:(p)ppGpp synthase/HD superfamily hydrolase
MKEAYVRDIQSESRKLFSVLERIPFSDAEFQKITDAYHIAMRLHAQQEPRSDGFYTEHILRVTRTLVETFHVKEPDPICAAILHDALEDHRRPFMDLLKKLRMRHPDSEIEHMISTHFGPHVASLIHALSTPKTGTKNPADRRKEYRDHVEHAIESEEVFLIKLADFFDNALKINDKPQEVKKRLAKKYVLLPEVFLERLKKLETEGSTRVTPEIVTLIRSRIEETLKQLEIAIRSDMFGIAKIGQ